MALVGVNHAERYVSYEGERSYPTTGRGSYLHPIQEAAKAEARLSLMASAAFDEFQLLRFRATNEEPYSFEWVDYNATAAEYASLLTRISRDYEQRFA